MTDQSIPVRTAGASLARRTRLALGLSALWTLVVWGSRIGLVEEGASWWSWARIAVSLGFGAALLIVWLRPAGIRPALAVAIMMGYAGWMVVVWIPSLVDTLGADEELGFRLVHLALGVISLASGAVIGDVARRLAFYPLTSTSTHTAANSAAR